MVQKKTSKNRNRLEIRRAQEADVMDILALTKRVYSDMAPYPEDMIRGQINNYPEGHMVAVYDEEIVGYSACIRVSGDLALKQHSWREITGGGFGSTHDDAGDYLYGYEICVDPNRRRLRIGQRFYNERKKLAQYYRLSGIVFAGRLPNLRKKLKEVKTVDNYIKLVKDKKLRDPVLGFQLRNGFEFIGVIENYLPKDKASLGYAAHLVWGNPQKDSGLKRTSAKSLTKKSVPDDNPASKLVSSVRVATVQYRQRKVSSFQEFAKIVEYFVDVVGDYKCDFVLFPELFTLQLLSVDNEPVKPHVAIEKMDQYTSQIKKLFKKLALKYNVNIIGGSHPVTRDGVTKNISFVFLRDGSIHEQGKIHPTPNEKYWWNIVGDNKLSAIQTDCGPIGVLICYDSEFPELSRHLVNQGVKILFVPFLTDERQGYCRVRYCSQARAVENQIYVVMSGSVGNLPNVQNIDIHYSQSCILTPCDFPFARDGIAADTTPNVETVAFADLRIDNLVEARNTGTVRNLKDRRHDLYEVKWIGS